MGGSIPIRQELERLTSVIHLELKTDIYVKCEKLHL